MSTEHDAYVCSSSVDSPVKRWAASAPRQAAGHSFEMLKRLRLQSAPFAPGGPIRRFSPMQKYCSYIQYWSALMPPGLPPFKPVTQAELRGIWVQHPECRRLVLEVERYRRVIAKVDHLYKTTHRAWREEVGGDLTALHLMLQLMTEERHRLPDVAGTIKEDSHD